MFFYSGANMFNLRSILGIFAIYAGVGLPATAVADVLKPDELLNLSLEQLTNIEVTSVSKSPEKANEAPAAIFVLTAEDIKRLGATSIPEALRVVPGLDVAQAGSHEWAVASRGSNSEFTDKMLVLIDGRTIYTPHFAGVWWDIQDVVLDDIERIEVIRGPGATLWGANAVNGVINIITKSAKDTQGGLAEFSAGNQIKADSTVRYGSKLGDNAYMRVYAKYNDDDDFRLKTGGSAKDNWHKDQTGFRADLDSSSSDKVTVQGDAYHMLESEIFSLPSITPPPVITSMRPEDANGFNLLGRWNHTYSKDSNTTVQAYFDQAVRKSAWYDDRINTADFDFQHVWTGIKRNEITWGVGYRLVDDYFTDTVTYSLNSPHRVDNLASGFLQDKITIVPDKLFFTLGSKLEKNDYTGWEVEPSARFSWLVDSNQTVWGAVSRAIKSPNRTLDDANLPVAAWPPGVFSGFLTLLGSHGFKSEDLVAYELGHRIQPAKSLSFDTSTFYNQYHNLLYGSYTGVPFLFTNPVTHATYPIFPVLPANANSAYSYGIEEAANWQVLENWKLSGAYTFLNLKFDHPDPFGRDFSNKQPQNQFNIRSTLLLPYNTEMDNALYYVSPLNAFNTLTGVNIASYYRLDTRLAWKATDGVELSLIGQNLLRSEHTEFSGFFFQSTEEVPRTVFANVRVKF